jgi:G6PDH family F420-dependent oxidoreductase
MHRDMTEWGYTLMGEQAGPRQLVEDAVTAEQVGYDFAMISDHYFPWLSSQGHSPYAWSVLGAAAYATDRLGLMTYVTCPSFRYHPAVVAQKAATVQLLSGGRFTLGLGAGENLNEHVVGQGWPRVTVRHQRLGEAVDIIKALFSGGVVDYEGHHFRVDRARLWDLPDRPPPIGIAISGPRSAALAGRRADLMIAVEPKEELGTLFDDAGGAGKPRVGQMAVCYDPDRDEARRRAHQQFRWFGAGWKVMSELPGTEAFAAATAPVTVEDVAAGIACGPDVDQHVEKLKQFVDAGFTHVGVIQIGGSHQSDFLRWSEKELLPALRSL